MTKPDIVFVALIIVFLGLSLENAALHSVMVDEIAHITSGVSHWNNGQLSVYRETPPLIQSLVALPVVTMGAEVGFPGTWHRPEIQLAVHFSRANASHLANYTFVARLVSICFALICGGLIYGWVRLEQGSLAALVCASIWFTDPNVLAHGSVATVDVGTSSICLLATYAFYRSLCRPHPWRAVTAGIFLGLALLSKFNMLALIPAWWIISLIQARSIPPESQHRPLRSMFTITITAIICVNAIYAFNGFLRPLNSYMFRSRLLTGEATLDRTMPPLTNRFHGSLIGLLPVPLPTDFVLGLDSVKWDEESLLLNLNSDALVRGGHWYSPFRTLAFKLPIGSISLLMVSAITLPYVRRTFDRTLIVCAVSATCFLTLLCFQMGLNWPVRYTLPSLPLIIVAIGPGVGAILKKRYCAWLIGLCILWNGVNIIQIRPSYFTFGNELVGGVQGAQQQFLGSNFDWGQDLAGLKRWQDQDSERRSMAISYYGGIEPETIGLVRHALPTSFVRSRIKIAGDEQSAEASGTFYWAISSNVLHGMRTWVNGEDDLWFYGTISSPFLKPSRAYTTIGNSIYVFKIGHTSTASSLSYKELEGCLIEGSPEGVLPTP